MFKRVGTGNGFGFWGRRIAAFDRERLVRDAASRGKYAPLHRHLAATGGSDWRVSFAELEAILGFELPVSPRLRRSWWSNRKPGAGHGHALSWRAAGWKTRAVDLEAETAVFERAEASPDMAGTAPGKRGFDLDEVWPAISGGSWPPGFTGSREQIHDECGRLTGGPQDETGHGP